MKYFKLLLNFVLFSTPVASRDIENGITQIYQEDYIRSFNQFQAHYNRTYSTENEAQERFQIFSKNLDYVRNHNANPGHPFQLGINQFADLREEEFRNFYLSPMPNVLNTPLTNQTSSPMVSSIDWRDYKAVNPIQNQEQCGSCWAFSAVAALEGAYAKKHKTLMKLSEQELVSCDKSLGDRGCQGGLPSNAFEYSKQAGGLYLESTYRYLAKNEACRRVSGKKYAKVSSWKKIDPHSDAIDSAIVNFGPISIGINAAGLNFQLYKSGIFAPLYCSSSLDHGVNLVGFSDDYYILRNSWGDTWGERGYMRIKKITGNTGVCGSYSMATAVVVE